MAPKGKIYIEKDVIANPELLTQLQDAVVQLGEKMKAAQPIMKAHARVGWGVDKAQRGIAADAVVSIAKAIKSLKGW